MQLPASAPHRGLGALLWGSRANLPAKQCQESQLPRGISYATKRDFVFHK